MAAARLALCLIAASVLAGGCGGGGPKPLTKPQYEQRMRAVLGPLGVQLGRLGTAASAARTPKQAAARIQDVQRALRKAADELDAIRAPAAVRTHHADFVDGIRELAGALDAAHAAALEGKPAELREAQEEAGRSAGARKLRRALGAIQDAGYDVGTA